MSDLLSPGQLFAGRYRIERFLAQGGYGAVYVAEALSTELRVALKVLFPHILGSEGAVEKFQQEARIAGRVKTDHIVKVLDAGFDADTKMPFLAMELLEGRDLEQIVEAEGPLAPPEVASLLRQLASGLDKAHGYVDKEGHPAPIVHRDLKPENLFLTHREDGTPLLKILDFGIAKVLSQSANLSQEIKGTPLYMANEQASGGNVSPQTDLWALGLIAFYLLTGKVYWRSANSEEGSLMALFGEVLTLPLQPPTERSVELGGPALPPAFDAWFLRCVHRRPAERFPSAGAAVAELYQAFGLPAPLHTTGELGISRGSLASQVELASPAQAALGSTEATLALGATNPPTAPTKKRSAALALLGVGAVAALLAVGSGVWLRRATPDASAEVAAPGVAAATLAETAAPTTPPPPAPTPPPAPPSAEATPPPSASAPPPPAAAPESTARPATARPISASKPSAPKPSKPTDKGSTYGER